MGRKIARSVMGAPHDPHISYWPHLFSLMFGSECILPIVKAIPTPRIESFDPVINDDARRMDMNLIEETCTHANIRNLFHKQKVARFYDAHVRVKTVLLGGLRHEGSYPVTLRIPTSLGRTIPSCASVGTRRIQASNYGQ